MKAMYVWSAGLFVLALFCAPSYANLVENVDHASVSGDVLAIAQGVAGAGSGGWQHGERVQWRHGVWFNRWDGAWFNLVGWGAGAQVAAAAWEPEGTNPGTGSSGTQGNGPGGSSSGRSGSSGPIPGSGSSGAHQDGQWWKWIKWRCRAVDQRQVSLPDNS